MSSSVLILTCVSIIVLFLFLCFLTQNACCCRSSDEIVRPRVPLVACLANYSAPEEVHDFYSTALKAKTTAIK